MIKERMLPSGAPLKDTCFRDMFGEELEEIECFSDSVAMKTVKALDRKT